MNRATLPLCIVSLPGVFHAAHQLLHLDVVYHRVARFRHLTRKSNVVSGQQGRRRVFFLLVGVFHVALEKQLGEDLSLSRWILDAEDSNAHPSQCSEVYFFLEGCVIPALATGGSSEVEFTQPHLVIG